MKQPLVAACLAGSIFVSSTLIAPALALPCSHLRWRAAVLRQPWVLPKRHTAASFSWNNSQPAQLAESIANNAKRVAERTGTIGWCYGAVKNALMPFGVELFGGAAWMAASQLLKDKRFQVVPAKDLRPGDIMVHGKSSTHPAGHIAVYLGNNAEASDHLQPVITTGTYGKTLVFRVKPKPTALPKSVASKVSPVMQLQVHNAQPIEQPAQISPQSDERIPVTNTTASESGNQAENIAGIPTSNDATQSPPTDSQIGPTLEDDQGSSTQNRAEIEPSEQIGETLVVRSNAPGIGPG